MTIRPPYKNPFKPAPAQSAVSNGDPVIEVKKKNPYDPQFFWKISISELLADAGIIAYAFYFSQYFFKENNILGIIKPWQLMGLYAMVALTLPWYLGYLYARWDIFYQKIITKIVKWFFIAIALAVLVYLMVMALDVPWDNLGKTDKLTENFAMFLTFLLVLGPMMSIPGFIAGQNDCENPKKESNDVNDPSVTGVMMMIVLAIGLLVWWANSDFTHNHSWMIIVVYLGSCVAAVIVFGVFWAFLTLLKKLGVYKPLANFFQSFFPLFIVSILILWNEIGMRLIMTSTGSDYAKISFGKLFFIVTVSGFIPFRLIMILTPPIRLINLLIGILAFSLYLYNIRQLCI